MENSHLKVVKFKVPHFSDLQEPQMVTLFGSGRAGTKFLQSYLDDHENILMIPGYPLMYLYPHFNDWCKKFSEELSWDLIIDLFCEKHASVLDSRKVLGLSGLERLGPGQNEHIEINEQMFRDFLKTMLDGLPICRRTFLLAVHYAYGLCKQWDLASKNILFYHIHAPQSLPELVNDFPNLKLIYMVRDPRASIHSGVRAVDISDQAKLNPTDSMRLMGRNFWILCRHQFDARHRLSSYLDQTQAAIVKLESFENVDHTMEHLADWLGIDCTQNILKSTFDGKLWWGDYGSTTAANGFNANVLSGKWKKSITKFDLFVIEGIEFDFFERYKYNRLAYKHDTFMNRLILIFAILFPSKIEWERVGFCFNPRVHLSFIRAASDEASGRTPRQDYTWNATYLYKWTYTDLRLWHKRWYERFLELANERFGKNRRGPYASFVIVISRLLYVGVQYGRFWMAILTFPACVFKRWSIYYGCLWRRVRKGAFLPRLLG